MHTLAATERVTPAAIHARIRRARAARLAPPAKKKRQQSTQQAAGGEHFSRLPVDIVEAIRRVAVEAEALERHLRVTA